MHLQMRLGCHSSLVKLDIESAFTVIPVHSDDHHLLGLCWEQKFYIDKTLPMCCKSSCVIFEAFSTVL